MCIAEVNRAISLKIAYAHPLYNKLGEILKWRTRDGTATYVNKFVG